MSSNLDLGALTTDDIIEEYKILHSRHQQLKKQTEEDAQSIHELKRNLDTALAAETYLTQELEHLSGSGGGTNENSQTTSEHHELEEVKKRYRNLLEEHENLQQDYDSQGEQMHKLMTKLKQTEKDLEDREAQQSSHLHEECQQRFSVLELENSELMQKLVEYEEAKVKQTFEMADREKTVAILQDQVSCLEQNLHFKRDELEEKIQLLESCQEQLVDANSKIAMLTSSPDQNDRKGNSLFAEVDDQRQAMKQLLAAQKKSYLDMKKVFSESKFEIHRLKRENAAMHTELQACSTIFCSADRTYQNKLNERVRQLMKQNDNLEKQLHLTQMRLRELANEKSVTWLDSMMDFCKRETDDLKSQLHAMSIQTATLEEQMRNVQQQMARWRFESLKSRCVLIDRENLLSEHNISFKPMLAMEFNIKEEEQKAALPRIIPKRYNPVVESEIIVLDTPVKPKIEATNIGPMSNENPLNESQLQEQETLDLFLTKENKTVAKPLKKGTPVRSRLGLNKVKRENQLPKDSTKPEVLKAENIVGEELKVVFSGISSKIKIEDVSSESATNQTEDVEEESMEFLTLPSKPQKKGTPIKLRPGLQIKVRPDEDLFPDAKHNANGTPVKFHKVQLSDSEENDITSPVKPLPKGTPIKGLFSENGGNQDIRSILTTKRNIFGDDSNKAVTFSSSQPIVHNPSPCEAEAKESMTPVAASNGDIKPFNTKKLNPNIIRRIVVSSRKPTK